MPSKKLASLILVFLCFIQLSTAQQKVLALNSDTLNAVDSSSLFLVQTKSLADSIISYGKLFLNTPYRYGAESETAFDCSGFTSYVFRNFGYKLSRTSFAQSQEFPRVKKADIQPGDLVFFKGRRKTKRVGHVGIVVDKKSDGHFDFIHASLHHGVTISSSQEGYFAKRFVKAERVINSNQLTTSEFTSTANSISTHRTIYHKVRRGETLTSIAMLYNCTVNDLKKWNKKTGSFISAGEKLRIKPFKTT